jgi:hypothetical protein
MTIHLLNAEHFEKNRAHDVVMSTKNSEKSGKHLAGGALSGLCSCVLLQPFDLVKTVPFQVI